MDDNADSNLMRPPALKSFPQALTPNSKFPVSEQNEFNNSNSVLSNLGISNTIESSETALSKKQKQPQTSQLLSASLPQNENKSSKLPQKFTSGSATGNPRNKCALLPGHSLMDWIRLGSSGCDLAGTKGVITPVTSAELSKHCHKKDAWIALRGRVYNVTKYMDFHPGGPEELMRGIGKDSTKLFDDVHAWVNFEQLLAKCYIGPLRNAGTADLDSPKPSRLADNVKVPNKSSIVNSQLFSILSALPAKTSINYQNPVQVEKPNTIALIESPVKSDSIPRFDWIQKTSELMLIFYTRPLCNPSAIINYKCDNQLDIRIFIDRSTYLYKLKLLKDIIWPSIFKVWYESGKIEIICRKREPELWTNFGTMEREKLSEIENLNFEYEVGEKMQITHDSFALTLKPKTNTIIHNPVGYHVRITASINGEDITRSYTPIPIEYLPNECPSSHIPFLIKSYSNGTLSKHITIQKNGDESGNALNLSEPKGDFDLSKLKQHSRIALLAAGSGITPILAILDHLLRRTANKVESVQLLFFNKTVNDIWCRSKLEGIAETDKRLIVRHILSEPDNSWNGEVGRITEEIITPLTTDNSQFHASFFCVCGPTPFNNLAVEFLNKQGINQNDYHLFQG